MGESRVENILESMIDNTDYNEQPQSRIEGKLLELKGALGITSMGDVLRELIEGSVAHVSYGDLISATRTTSDGVTKSYDWEIIGKNEDGDKTLTLQLYRVWDELMTMGDEKFATFPSGLAVGHYSITLPEAKALLIDEDTTAYITVASAIEAGGYLTFNGRALRAYEADGTAMPRTAVSWKKEATAGTTYTDLGTADGNTEHINKIERAVLGVNDYENSPLRAWLNDDRPAAERDEDEWIPENEFSIKPKSMDGFLYGWDSDLADMMIAVPKRIFKLTSASGDHYSGTVTTLNDKAWLLAYEEIGHTYPGTITSPADVSSVEGEKYGWFDFFDRIRLTESGTAVSCLLRSMDCKYDSVICYGDNERTDYVQPGIAPCIVISGGADE